MDIPSNPRDHFEALYAADADPWKFKERWYEARKRALTLACLPRPRYASAYEPGCANGELSAALADRCDSLLISDGAAAAVALARQRVADRPHVAAIEAWVPDAWPDAHFDLIVISEFVYFLTEAAMDTLAAKAAATLSAGGDLIACHWRRPIPGCRIDGDAVHERLARAIPLPRVWSLTDPDFRLEIWSADARTVGQREALA